MSNLTLFQIENEYKQLVEALIEQDGEFTPEQEQSLQITKEALQVKSINYAKAIKQLEYESDIIDAEIKRLAELKAKRNSVVEKLKDRIQYAMELFEAQKIESEIINISFRKSESVEITDEVFIPDTYMKPQPSKPDKTAIKKDLKAGISIPGCELKTNNNIQIK